MLISHYGVIDRALVDPAAHDLALLEKLRLDLLFLQIEFGIGLIVVYLHQCLSQFLLERTQMLKLKLHFIYHVGVASQLFFVGLLVLQPFYQL